MVQAPCTYPRHWLGRGRSDAELGEPSGPVQPRATCTVNRVKRGPGRSTPLSAHAGERCGAGSALPTRWVLPLG